MNEKLSREIGDEREFDDHSARGAQCSEPTLDASPQILREFDTHNLVTRNETQEMLVSTFSSTL